MNASTSDGDLALLAGLYSSARETLGRFVVGNEDLIELIFVCLLSGGHMLIEGVPGTAKTTVAKTVARISGSEFRRVQCAVDTQPADIVGVRIFDQKQQDFVLKKGPIFTNILLIDEINRLNPKTQSAFIEIMSERQATIDGITLDLPSPFFVIATQNPFEFEGTFPLIEAQKDRFMFSAPAGHLTRDQELEIVRRVHTGALNWEEYYHWLPDILDDLTIDRLVGMIDRIRMEEPVLQYITDLVMATRAHGDVRLGASSRASIALVRGGKAAAALRNRAYVIPDDIKRLAPAVLSHRLLLEREAEISGITPHRVVQEILETVEVP
ncbi:moxr-like atpase [hydrocarbon metagenome]|uniref:Moxr-like atpase n=1 Tax=hydrocarbon metagenome TaxID=938273 RepID=A0A0W8FKF4_9ZZZZ